MPLSEKRLAANRANAKQSTGPRTLEGKRRSSQNALEHGVLANAILIEGESKEGFLNLCQAYEREHNPQTPTEQSLVNKAVTSQWRALRAAKLESAAITREMRLHLESTEREDDPTRVAVRTLHETSAHMERLSLYEHRFGLQHRRAIRNLRSPRETRKMNLNKRTHFNEATKELIAKKPISKPIFKPSKPIFKPSKPIFKPSKPIFKPLKAAGNPSKAVKTHA